MKPLLPRLPLVLLALAAPVHAQAPLGAPRLPEAREPATCPACGVVVDIRRLERETKPAPDRERPSGLVATIPMGTGKPQVGSSEARDREDRPPVETWQVSVRLDDGRFQILRMESAGDLRKGDKVRIVEGRAVLR